MAKSGLLRTGAMTPQQKVQRALVDLVDMPGLEYWGYLLAAVEVIEDPTAETAWTNGVQLGWSPDYVDTLTLSKTRTLFAHEVDHNADGHPWRRDGRDFELWNDACDYNTNPKLIDAGFEAIEGWLFDPQYVGKPPEWIYARLQEKKEQEKKAGKPDQQQGGAAAGSDKSSPDNQSDQSGNSPGKQNGKKSKDKNSPRGSSDAVDGRSSGPPEEREGSGQGQRKPSPTGEVRDAPPEAAEQGVTQTSWQQISLEAIAAAKNMGHDPAHSQWLLDQIRNPKEDWRAVMAKWFDEIDDNDYSWEFPDVDFIQMGLYLPDFKNERMGPVVAGWDTSGSVLSEQNVFGDELADIINRVKPERVYAMYTDAKVHKVEEFDPADEVVKFNPVGGGGTSFVPVFEEVEKRGIRPALLIYFTDLLGRFPEVAPSYPVLWVSTNPNGKAPFGEVTYLLDGGHRR